MLKEKNKFFEKPIFQYASQILKSEADAIYAQIKYLNDDFENAVLKILDSKGKLVITGIGKSGIIGRKISATMVSTGTPSFFLHPGEAYHGDLGSVAKDDIILIISKSGETDEILKLIPFFRQNDNFIILLTGKRNSTLSKYSNIVISFKIDNEACPFNLAPTTSTTVALAYGDALALSLMQIRNFKPESFARFHPGGHLGYKLLTRAKDIMHSTNLPVVNPDSTVAEIFSVITGTRLGITVVIENEKILGVITDGDIRRAFEKFGKNAYDFNAKNLMTEKPLSICEDTVVLDIEKIMNDKKIQSLLVSDKESRLLGIVDVFSIK
jgi:arabinose-5-phosphate isomerase